MAVSRFGRFIFQTLLIAMATVVSVLLVACSNANPSGGAAWEPTDEDPVYTDENGVTWGISYHPEGASEYALVDPDMLLTQGDGGAVGYVSVEESTEALLNAGEDCPDTPGIHEIDVSVNLYEFLTYEVIGTDTFRTTVMIGAENANAWFPGQYDDVSTTDDGRTWGSNLVDSTCDMLYVMADDTGCYGFVSAVELREAEELTMLEVAQTGKTATMTLNVVLYDSNTIVGQYAVTTHA